jgi:hypothetical protein
MCKDHALHVAAQVEARALFLELQTTTVKLHKRLEESPEPLAAELRPFLEALLAMIERLIPILIPLFIKPDAIVNDAT